MLLAMFCIAANDAMGKVLTQHYSVWQVLWLRSCVWMICALLWVAQRGGVIRALRSRTPLLQALRSLVLVAEVSVFIFAFKYLPLADVSAVSAGTPLVVLIFAVLFLGERIGIHRWTAVLVGLFGMLLITRPGISVFGSLSLLPLAGVALWGIYQVLVRMVSRVDSAETTLLWAGIAIFVVTGSIAPWSWQPIPDVYTWAQFGAVGLLNTAGHFGLIMALQRSEASALQPFSYSIVLWALLIGWFAFNEKTDTWTLIGTTMIMGGGLYALHREYLLRSADVTVCATTKEPYSER